MRILSLVLFTVIWQLTTLPALAQHMNEKDSPCADVGTTSDLVTCLYKAGGLSDIELNKVYNEIRKSLDPNELKSLVATEKLWLKYRDSNCSAERELYGNGTAGPPVYLACLESMTRARTKELRVTYAVRLK
jgi:uncharacterized protein YecT (DUF1311 family)